MLEDPKEKQEKILMRVLWGNRSSYGNLEGLLDIGLVDEIKLKIKHNLVDRRNALVKQFENL